MLTSSSFFEQCSPSYQIELQKLDELLLKSDDENEKQKVLEEFSSKYLMPKEHWKLLSELALNKEDEKEIIKSQNSFTPKAIYQFYFDRKNGMFLKNEQCYRKLLKFRGKKAAAKLRHVYEFVEKDITFPHCHIKKRYRQYEECSSVLPDMETYQTYQKMRTLYDKIKAAEDDTFKWFTLLKEADDEEFLCQNVEYRLVGNLHNLELWILYMDYLKDTNPKEMLHLYSKYCRFYVDDLEAKEKYSALVQEHGPITVSWKNTFSFETHELPPTIDGGKKKDELPKFEYEELFSSHQPPKNLPKNVFDTIFLQDFSFPRPIIRYILQEADHILLRRLFNSCKYFYAKKWTPICYKFELTEYPIDADFYKETLQIDYTYSTSSTILKNYHITTSLTALYNEEMNPRHFSEIIPKLHQCDAKFIWIKNQIFNFEEFRFLVGHGNVLTLCLPEVLVQKTDTDFVELEEIMALLPKIQELLIEKVNCNSKTAEILSTQKYHEKFEYFHISDITGDPCDPFLLQQYFVKNMAKSFRLFLTFERNFNEEFQETFKAAMNDPECFPEKVRKTFDIYFKN